jgi:hypothetical protein
LPINLIGLLREVPNLARHMRGLSLGPLPVRVQPSVSSPTSET